MDGRKYARRRKLAWRKKGRLARSRVPLGAPLWEIKYRERGIPESELYVEHRTPWGVKRHRSLWTWQEDMRNYLIKPFSKQKQFDDLLQELKEDFNIDVITPYYFRNTLERPINPRTFGINYEMKPIRVSPRIKTKISRSVTKSKVLSKTGRGREYRIE